MEPLNNVAPEQGSDAAAFQALFSKYEERNHKPKRKTKEEMLAPFFNPRKDTEIFRALPLRSHLGEQLIEEGFFHKVQAGKYIKNSTAVFCPAKNNPKVQAKDGEGNLVFDQDKNPLMVDQYCPLCAKAKAIKAKQDKTLIGKKEKDLTDPNEKAIFAKNKELFKKSSQFEAKLYYIIRGIDRGAEKDGVKFWRFKHNFKSQGIHDKLWKPIIQDYYKQTGKMYNNATDGVDLMISVVDNEFNGSSYRDVSAIIPRIPSPLHSDALIAKQWLDDKTTWRDVFKPKKAPGITEEQYLKLASEEREPNQVHDWRNTPYYDEDLKKWIFPNHPDLEEKANTKNQNLDADEYADAPDEEGYVGAAMSVVNNQAADITQMSTAPTTQTFNHGAADLSAPKKEEVPQQQQQAPATNGAATTAKGPYDDLPF